MRSFREQMARMRREYRREATRLDDKIAALYERMDERYQTVEERFLGIEQRLASLEDGYRSFQEQFRRSELQVGSIRDELGAIVESFVQLRADNREVSRTLQGRVRLMENRLTRMLDLVEETYFGEEIVDLKARVERLEKKSDSAA